MNRRRALGWVLAVPAAIDVEFGAGDFEVGRAALLDWVTASARAVSAYYGRFPVAHARVDISPAQGSRISAGSKKEAPPMSNRLPAP
jgi:hypothetical protein